MEKQTLPLLKTVVVVGAITPISRLAYKGLTGGLGANPIEFVLLSTGTWALVFLMVTLSITPLRTLTGQSWPVRFRRSIGLFAFFYACLHFTTYVWLDKYFDVPDMWKDVMKRPFIAAGFMAFVLLIPLAATSTAGTIRRMGARHWQLLHRLIYSSAVCAVAHYWWKVKADIRKPAIYASILGALLLFRLLAWAFRLRAR